jgi:hypothetical protein
MRLARREANLARREALETWPPVPRREHSRKLARTEQDAGAFGVGKGGDERGRSSQSLQVSGPGMVCRSRDCHCPCLLSRTRALAVERMPEDTVHAGLLCERASVPKGYLLSVLRKSAGSRAAINGLAALPINDALHAAPRLRWPGAPWCVTHQPVRRRRLLCSRRGRSLLRYPRLEREGRTSRLTDP